MRVERLVQWRCGCVRLSSSFFSPFSLPSSQILHTDPTPSILPRRPIHCSESLPLSSSTSPVQSKTTPAPSNHSHSIPTLSQLDTTQTLFHRQQHPNTNMLQ
ncbi:hypothetical protein BLNAU_3423 [Blattamonas nauphoetae]|uniref:Uncharacterized protein n=1 Tax=Blattamonas nauphoetae TaxID=2049346 RepID=A0ABQ9YD49_9EUKA|nr:hypothetical protein BLNAU_3423 [Blattamonas nauphoetae]